MTKMRKLLATVIDGGTINRPEHPIGHIGRTRDLEKMSAGEAFAVHGEGFAVCRLQLAVRSGLDGTHGTNGTNGNHMTSLLNRKPAAPNS